PAVVGYEVAGVVDAVGSDVTGFRAGDRVLALTRFDGYASAVVVPAAQAFATPPVLTDVEAAAVPVNYLTAFIALVRLANTTADDVVLIYGAGGGVGIAATQLAKLRHATVIGTASTSKIDTIRAIGVDHAIDHRRQNVAAEVRRLTSGRGADVILDPIGGRQLRVSYDILAPLGRLVIYGVSSAAVREAGHLWPGGRSAAGHAFLQAALAHESQSRRSRTQPWPLVGRGPPAPFRDAFAPGGRRGRPTAPCRRGDVPPGACRRRTSLSAVARQHRESRARCR